MYRSPSLVYGVTRGRVQHGPVAETTRHAGAVGPVGPVDQLSPSPGVADPGIAPFLSICL